MNQEECIRLFNDDKNRAIVLTDKHGIITYCNDCWLELCGFTCEEVNNKTNKILQGLLTERDISQQIGRDISYGLDVDTYITNYKKNGMPFKNHLTISKIDDGFIAEIRDVGKCDYEIDYDKAMNKRLCIVNKQMVQVLV